MIQNSENLEDTSEKSPSINLVKKIAKEANITIVGSLPEID